MGAGKGFAVVLYSELVTFLFYNIVPSGHILTKKELQVLATLLAAYSDEKLKEIKVALQEDKGGDISREGVEESLRQNGLSTIADELKETLQKGIISFKTQQRLIQILYKVAMGGC